MLKLIFNKDDSFFLKQNLASSRGVPQENELNLLDLPVLLSHCVAFMTDLNVGQIISNT